MWPDIELAVMLGLRPQLSGVRVTDELPPQLETKLPLVLVQLVPGGGDNRIEDEAILDVAAFAADRAAMWALAERARTAMLRLNGSYAGGLRIDTVDTESRPGEVPYGNVAVRRAIATYRLTSRAQAPA